MDTHHNEYPVIGELERKAEELINLMLSLCEEEIHVTSAMPDFRASSLASAAMTAQNAIQAFLALTRIR